MPIKMKALSQSIKRIMWVNTIFLSLVVPVTLFIMVPQNLKGCLVTACMGIFLGAGNHLLFSRLPLRKADLEMIAILNGSFLDDLTGVYTRRGGMQRLKEELARYRRNGRKFSLALLDADHFKEINDTYGHLAGDYVLKEIAGSIRSGLRKCDVVVRYGGEEFLVIMPETDADQALQPLDRLRQLLSRTDIVYGESRIAVSVSIGLASIQHPGEDEAELLSRADKALYRAKLSGRNKVVSTEQVSRLKLASVN